MIEHQRQPTATSCGPTCVAMLLARPVDEVLRALPAARTLARRGLKNHRTNVGELDRLLRRGGMALGDRQRIGPGGFTHTFGNWLLRIDHPTGRGWHWVVMSHGLIFDPARAGTAIRQEVLDIVLPTRQGRYTMLTHQWLRLRRGRVSAYIVLEPWGAAEVERLRKVGWP